MDQSEEPPRKVCVSEFTPIPEDYTAIPYLRKVIQQSNAEPTPRKRFAKGVALYGEGIRRALKEKDLTVAAEIAKEAVCMKRLSLKSSTTVAPLLYAFLQTKRFVEAEDLLTKLMDSAEANNNKGDLSSPSALNASQIHQQLIYDIFDDAVMTVAIRILNAQNASVEKISALLLRIPKDFLKRRILHESLDVALKREDVSLSRAVFKIAVENDVDLWDCDFEKLLATLVQVAKKDGGEGAGWPSEGWTSPSVALLEVLEHMEKCTPVVGKRVAVAMKALAREPSAYDCIKNPRGQCDLCGTTLRGFTLTDEEFGILASDIIEKLVTPALSRRSHYEPESEKVPEYEVEERRQIFDQFCSRVANDDFNAVIDGANVGYYGVSCWYAKAKKDLLVRGGRDPSSVTHAEMSEMPLPIDVCPSFEQVNYILEKARNLGYKPRVIFHQRHLVDSPRLYGRNAELLASWRAQGVVIESPGFLNDDYCWLYACITKRNGCSIISNDLMRDHHFLMLSQQSFVRWRQRNRLTFRVGFCGTVASGTLSVPSAFSTWVQRVVEEKEKNKEDTDAAAAAGPEADVGTVEGEETKKFTSNDLIGTKATRWHVPFGHSETLDQATNKKKPGDALGKDGDDSCEGWMCLTV